MTCGSTALVMVIIESKAYVFSVGDCKGYLFRNDVLYQLNLDHLPVKMIERRAGETSDCVLKMLEVSSNTTD